jgi:hypothetical protein
MTTPQEFMWSVLAFQIFDAKHKIYLENSSPLTWLRRDNSFSKQQGIEQAELTIIVLIFIALIGEGKKRA